MRSSRATPRKWLLPPRARFWCQHQRASTTSRLNCTRTPPSSRRNAMSMNEPITIPKLTTAQSDSLNYSVLRKQGIDYITALGSNFWTDFNIHDPGITCLDAPCYALTDLAYRTSFSTVDLLSVPP